MKDTEIKSGKATNRTKGTNKPKVNKYSGGRKKSTDRAAQSSGSAHDELTLRRLKFVAQLPMGRPFAPSTILKSNAVNGTDIEGEALQRFYGEDATGSGRPMLRSVVASTGQFNWDNLGGNIPPWVERVAQHIYNKLRDEVRSNTPYTVKDVAVYLGQAVSIYVYTIYVKRNLLATAAYDTRAPELWKAITAYAATVHPNGEFSSTEHRRFYTENTVPQAYTSDLGNTWLNTAKLTGLASYFVLPPKVMAILDEYLGCVHIEDVDSQYDIMKLLPESFCCWSHSRGNFQSFDQSTGSNPGGLNFTANGLLIATNEFGKYISDAPLPIGTLIADMRRISGVERIVIEMPPEMGAAIPVSTSPVFYTGVRNGYSITEWGVNKTLNYEVTDAVTGQVKDAYPDVLLPEIRIQSTGDLSDAEVVGLSLLCCHAIPTNGNITHYAGTPQALFYVDHEELFQYAENGDRFADSIITKPCVAFLSPDSQAIPEIDISIGRMTFWGMMGLATRSLIPSVCVMLTKSEGLDPDYKSMAVIGEVVNGTRVSMSAILEIQDAYMETLFVM